MNDLHQVGDLFADRFRILRHLAEGGTCSVHQAWEVSIGRAVALKLLLARWQRHPVMIDRLRREVDIARRIEHPHIRRSYEYGTHEGRPFATVEWIDGIDLATRLRTLGPPPMSDAADIARQICHALAATHNQGIIHRDIKPGNILLSRDGFAKVSDFGYAFVIGEPCGTDARIGTPPYMAPEQLETGRVSIQSDIYSLGLLMFELFTGQPFHRTVALQELARRHQLDPRLALQASANRLPSDLKELIACCLRLEQRERPPSADWVAARLAQA